MNLSPDFGILHPMKVSVIIPAYNSENCIASTVAAAKGIPQVSEIIVVDNGSYDESAEVAESAGALVYRLEKNLGKGGGVRYGLTKANGDIFLFLDDDLEEAAAEAEKLIAPMMENKADMTIATFPPAKRKGGFGFVKGLARWGIKRCTGLVMQTPLSGQRALKKEIMEKVTLADGFGLETALTIDAARAGFRILEVETNMSHHETGRSPRDFLHRLKQFAAVAGVLVRRM